MNLYGVQVGVFDDGFSERGLQQAGGLSPTTAVASGRVRAKTLLDLDDPDLWITDKLQQNTQKRKKGTELNKTFKETKLFASEDIKKDYKMILNRM